MKVYLLIILILSLFTDISAQKQKKSDMLFNEAKASAQAGDYEKAVEHLQQILKTETGYYQAYFALADIYHNLKNKVKEIESLQKGLSISGDNFPAGYKFLGQALYSGGDYEGALKHIERYHILTKTADPETKRLLESCRFAVGAIKNPVSFTPENAGGEINSNDDEYWPCLDAEGKELVFTRLINYNSDGQKLPFPQEDLYCSLRDSDKWYKSVALASPVNTPENEGAQCISADGRLLFFTACGRPDGQGSCDIYMSVRKMGRWSAPVNLGEYVNTGAWETQPSVSADGHYLFFTSNRKGGKGKMDIWRAEKLGITRDGYPVYGKAVNPEEINTEGNEMSPFIHADGKTLYFASDTWPGLGGNDLFVTRIVNEKFSPPKNLGYPINSHENEEGMIVEINGENAWYTSNRSGFGGRDIFTFRLPENVRPQAVSYARARVFDKKTGKKLVPGMKLYNLSSGNKVQQQISPDENEGEFLFCLTSGNNYALSVEKEGYLFYSHNFDLEQTYTKNKPYILDIGMDPVEEGRVTVLNNIFFDTDSFTLQPRSKPQLDEIVEFLKNNPGLKIEIGGHTDNTGSEAYNLELSKKRAASVVNHLVSEGIPKERLESKGYGYSRPLTENSTIEGRSSNRRTEMKVVGKNQAIFN